MLHGRVQLSGMSMCLGCGFGKSIQAQGDGCKVFNIWI